MSHRSGRPLFQRRQLVGREQWRAPGSTGLVSATLGLVLSGCLSFDQEELCMERPELCPPPLEIAGLTPPEGLTSGGFDVTIEGAGFTEDTEVIWDGAPAPLSERTQTTLKLKVPPGSPGLVDVEIRSFGRTVIDAFLYNAWASRNGGLPDDGGGVETIYQDRAGRILAATIDGPVALWDPDGQSWSPVASRPRRVRLLAGDGSYLYAVDRDEALWRLDWVTDELTQIEGLPYDAEIGDLEITPRGLLVAVMSAATDSETGVYLLSHDPTPTLTLDWFQWRAPSSLATCPDDPNAYYAAITKPYDPPDEPLGTYRFRPGSDHAPWLGLEDLATELACGAVDGAGVLYAVSGGRLIRWADPVSPFSQVIDTPGGGSVSRLGVDRENGRRLFATGADHTGAPTVLRLAGEAADTALEDITPSRERPFPDLDDIVPVIGTTHVVGAAGPDGAMWSLNDGR